MAKNIGYDFDGVLHTNVGPADAYGQRGTNRSGPYTPFNEIINQIELEIILGHQVYIVTARHDSSANLKIIQDHLDAHLKNYAHNVPIHFTNNQNKKHVIHNLKINIFYDDSHLRIRELYTATKQNELPDLLELYLVKPESRTWTLINELNIQIECGIQTDDRFAAILHRQWSEGIAKLPVSSFIIIKTYC